MKHNHTSPPHGGNGDSPSRVGSNAPIGGADIRFRILQRMLAGSTHALNFFDFGPGPIRLPADESGRDALIYSHLTGGAASVEFAPLDKPARMIRVEALQLGGYLPDAAGRCPYLAVDLDGGGHGPGGLADPLAAARCIAERAAAGGLFDGLLIVRSRNGGGVHVFIIPPELIALADAVLAVAFLAVQARKVADHDADDSGGAHAFRTCGGNIAEPGQSGAFELFPCNSERPARGFSIALPFGGVSAQRGGGVPLDVFSATPTVQKLDAVPTCRAEFWRRFMADARSAHDRKRRAVDSGRRRDPARKHARQLDPRTEALLSGAIAEGARNKAAFCGYGDLVRAGVHPSDAESAVIAGAVRCGLSVREAAATVRSAARRWEGWR